MGLISTGMRVRRAGTSTITWHGGDAQRTGRRNVGRITGMTGKPPMATRAAGITRKQGSKRRIGGHSVVAAEMSVVKMSIRKVRITATIGAGKTIAESGGDGFWGSDDFCAVRVTW